MLPKPPNARRPNHGTNAIIKHEHGTCGSIKHDHGTDDRIKASKSAKIRASKAEDKVVELLAKARQLETELDLTSEKFGIISLSLVEKEKALLAAEAEMNALNRRVQSLE